jgi:hypothetical protein
VIAGKGRQSSPSAAAGIDAVYLPEAMADRDLKRALDPWRLGDLVHGVRLFWAAPSGSDCVTGLDVGEVDGDRWAVVQWQPDENGEDACVWGVVTSQTCDIATTGPGQRHPTVQVAPLKRLDGTYDPGKIAEIRRGKSVELVYVSVSPELGEWAVDLRMSLPVSKAVLAGQTRRSAFASEREELEFATKVAAKQRRPALHDEIGGKLVDGLRELVTAAQTAGATWPDQLEQFRLLVTGGDRLAPTDVLLVAIAHSDALTARERCELRAWRRRECKRLMKAANITLAPVAFVSLNKLDVVRYRDSTPLHVPELGRAFI